MNWTRRGAWEVTGLITQADWEEVTTNTRVSIPPIPDYARDYVPAPGSCAMVLPAVPEDEDESARAQRKASALQAMRAQRVSKKEEAVDVLLGASWIQAILFCNACSLQLGRDPAYCVNGVSIMAPVSGGVKVPKVAGGNGVRLPVKQLMQGWVQSGTVEPVAHVDEWMDDISSSSQSRSYAQTRLDTVAEVQFALPWMGFRLVRSVGGR